jgi:uroporphyrinogen-III synthase
MNARPADSRFTVRAWATGTGTRHALLAAGVPAGQVDAPPADSPRFDSEALWGIVASQCDRGDRVLIVRGGDGRDWLEQQLLARGAAADGVIAYERAAPVWTPQLRAMAEAAGSDAWIFSSSEAIANLRAALPAQDWGAARVIATHPRIAQTAREAGFRVVCESRPPLADVVAALESLG